LIGEMRTRGVPGRPGRDHAERPVEIAEWTGYIRGDDVTIQVSGISGGGYSAKWHYQLRRMDGQWRITREEDDL